MHGVRRAQVAGAGIPRDPHQEVPALPVYGMRGVEQGHETRRHRTEGLMALQLALVTWWDAWQDTDNFSTAHGIAQTHKPLVVETLGWIVKDDEVGISVVNERTNEDGEEFRGRTFIPRAMVRSVTLYKLSKPRPPKSQPHPEVTH